ncbi:hypothetical protein ACYOEI_08555 [Singulisphaera rosea]
MDFERRLREEFARNPRGSLNSRFDVCRRSSRALAECLRPQGHVDFLEVISDPENNCHNQMLEWIGRHLDPEVIDPAFATRHMKVGLPDRRTIQ